MAIGLGLGVNMLLDPSPGVTHDARFLGYQAARKGPSHVRYSSWREPNAEERFTCTSGRQDQLCPRLQQGTPVVVTVRRGALGWQWVEKVAPR